MKHAFLESEERREKVVKQVCAQQYNVREYAKRRVTLGFREGAALEGESAAAAYANGLQQFEMLRRQAPSRRVSRSF